jgi:hypothetical protein
MVNVWIVFTLAKIGTRLGLRTTVANRLAPGKAKYDLINYQLRSKEASI